jgi:hypothetical protein
LVAAAAGFLLAARSCGGTVPVRAAFAAKPGLTERALARALRIAVAFEAAELLAATQPAQARRKNREAFSAAAARAALDRGTKAAAVAARGAARSAGLGRIRAARAEDQCTPGGDSDERRESGDLGWGHHVNHAA